MSGNSTRLGVGLASSRWDALAAAGLVFAFIVGVATGTLIGRRSEVRRVSSVMVAVAVLLALAAWFGSHHHLLASLAITALAMGAENATLERDGRVRFGLTYMTGSVVKLGQALADLLSGVPGAIKTRAVRSTLLIALASTGPYLLPRIRDRSGRTSNEHRRSTSNRPARLSCCSRVRIVVPHEQRPKMFHQQIILLRID